MEGGGWRVEGGGWKVEGGGWSVLGFGLYVLKLFIKLTPALYADFGFSVGGPGWLICGCFLGALPKNDLNFRPRRLF